MSDPLPVGTRVMKATGGIGKVYMISPRNVKPNLVRWANGDASFHTTEELDVLDGDFPVFPVYERALSDIRSALSESGSQRQKLLRIRQVLDAAGIIPEVD